MKSISDPRAASSAQAAYYKGFVKLGDGREFSGFASSKKNAQHAAALEALKTLSPEHAGGVRGGTCLVLK